MVFIIAVGIGASTAVFTIVDQTLFRLPPFADADRLVQVIHLDGPGGGGNALNPDKLLGWRGQLTIFDVRVPVLFVLSCFRGWLFRVFRGWFC